MIEYQVTSWREIPSMVAAREGDTVVKVPLPARFQEAIDEAAMRGGATDSEAYLDGWTRGEWTMPAREPDHPTDLADHVARELDETWDQAAISAYLESL